SRSATRSPTPTGPIAPGAPVGTKTPSLTPSATPTRTRSKSKSPTPTPSPSPTPSWSHTNMSSQGPNCSLRIDLTWWAGATAPLAECKLLQQNPDVDPGYDWLVHMLCWGVVTDVSVRPTYLLDPNLDPAMQTLMWFPAERTIGCPDNAVQNCWVHTAAVP